jgi:membrane protease YdiL (CAAX protease family)
MTGIEASIRKHQVLAYYILTFVISWGGGLIVLGRDGILGISQPSRTQFLDAILAGIVGPAAAAVTLTGLVDGPTGLRSLRSRLLDWRADARWYAVALLTGPLLASSVLFALSWADSAFVPTILVSDHKLSLLLIGAAVGLGAGFFEELGWTGFAVPRLRRRHGVLTTGLIVGFLWGAWHLPLFSGRGSSSGVPNALYLFVLLFSFLPPFRVLLVWLYGRTGSLPLVIIMHAGLSTSSLILQPRTAGIEVVVYDLSLATVLWVLVALVAAVNGRRLDSRTGRTSQDWRRTSR